MAAKTLFEVAKPIIFVLNFMGYGLGVFSKFNGEIDYTQESAYYLLRTFVVLLSVPCLDYYLLLNKTQLGNLVSQFRLFPVWKESGKALKKCLRLFYFYLAIKLIPFIVLFWWLCNLWLLLSLFQLALFPVFLCYFACLVSIYCVARVKELVQELKGARSSLRRAKMTSDLIREYYRLKRLASMTNKILSKAMSLFHEFFVMMFALVVVIVDSKMKDTKKPDGGLFAVCLLLTFDVYLSYSLFLTLFFAHVFPFLMYKLVAPLANQMHSLIFEALVDIALVDDQWLSRDPILRPLLIKMRVLHVFDVSHIVLGEASFTLFGEAIEGEALFTMLLESIDMYNTISTPTKHVPVLASLGLKVANAFLGDHYSTN